MSQNASPDGTVYIVQSPPIQIRPGHPPRVRDLSSAQRYGKLMPVLEEFEQPSLHPGPSLHKMNRALRSFDPTKDFLCYAGGDPMSIALALVALRNLGLREVQMLRWDRERDTEGVRTKGGYYMPVTTPLMI